MFNIKMFQDLYNPSKPDSKEIFKNYKVTEFPANKKRIYSIAWNKHGSKLISGS